jgi:hypothetical protein
MTGLAHMTVVIRHPEFISGSKGFGPYSMSVALAA